MLKKLKRAVSGAAALCFLYSNVLAVSGIDPRSIKGYKNDKLVKVIVGVKGGAVLSLPEAADQGSDFLQTDLASRAQAEILQNQRFAQGSIMSLYPDLEVECTYTSLINGFSCKLPESIIPEVESSPYVDYVEQTRSTSVPDMNKAASMSGADLFLEDTGYAGEGMVIAVLDTELDITHPMFAPLPDDTKVKLTKQDIIDAVNSKSLSIDVDPEKAYVSSKLPFVVNYADSKEHRYDTADEDYYHGTHVCGIAAGNKVSYDDAGEISGVASDSQLIFFKIAGSYEDTGVRSMDNDLILAAMEDSVKLGADVINCSFGGDEEILQDDPQEIAYESAENAGVIICAAAGNEADSVYREGMCTPENVDRSTVASPSSAVGNVSVASADNSGVSGGYFALAESRDIIRYKDDTVAEHGFEKLLSEEELEYVSCGLGRPEDLQGKDLSGKLALIDRGELPFYEKVANAEEVGAAGVIFVSDSDDESLEIYVGEGVPCCIVTKSDGEKLKNAGVQKITAANQEEYADRVAMSTFSSRGTNETLRLKPDITGIGGSVISAGYNNSFEEMSGTSMATPYASGCFALTLGYLENNGFELKGAQRVNFVKNLLMNSAKPISGANAYVSPRLQGAGLISLSNMLNTKAVMTSPETNMANVELYDMLPDSFSFDVDLTSISNEDVSFGKCELFVTTDSVQYSMSVDDNILGEDVPVKCSYEISGLDTVAAGEVSHGKVTVTIDPAEVQQLRKLFPNGYFIEGFVQLSGSSNCSDISIPFMGFSSDWVNIPIFDRDYTDPDKYCYGNVPMTNIGSAVMPLGIDFPLAVKTVKESLSKFDDQVPYPGDEDKERLEDYYKERMKYAVDSLCEQSDTVFSQENYVSPNSNGYADRYSNVLQLLREAYLTSFSISNNEGEIMLQSEPLDQVICRNSPILLTTVEDLSNLDNGSYQATTLGYINYPGAENKKQTYTSEFIVDNTYPQPENVRSYEENGRQYITFEVSDDNLDTLYVLGKGKGGTAGEYDPDAFSGTGFTTDDISETFSVFRALTSLDDERLVRISGVSLLPVTQYLSDVSTDSLTDDIDFVDMIDAECNEGDSFSITYDVTDLESYSFSFTDKAYNVYVYANGAPVVGNIEAPAAVPPGAKLSLTEPTVTGDKILAKYWQISFDGTDWRYFDPDTLMTEDHNGAYLRFYAENEQGYGFSNAVRILVDEDYIAPVENSTSPKEDIAPVQEETTPTSEETKAQAAIAPASTANPSTGAYTAAGVVTLTLGLLIASRPKKKK